jgi:hypothetical protein
MLESDSLLTTIVVNTDNVRTTQHWGAHVLLLQWKSNITYSECVFIDLGFHHAMHMRHIGVQFLLTIGVVKGTISYLYGRGKNFDLFSASFFLIWKKFNIEHN